jgi:hypothetical protein
MYTLASETSTRATRLRLRSGASVTEGNESMAETSIGRSSPPTPATSVASTRRSGGAGNGGSIQVNTSGKWKLSGGLSFQLLGFVLERQQHARVDLEGEVEVDRAVAGLLRVQVDLPRLAEGVGLDVVALVMDVKAVVDGMILEVGDEASHIDDGHPALLVDGCRPSLPLR